MPRKRKDHDTDVSSMDGLYGSRKPSIETVVVDSEGRVTDTDMCAGRWPADMPLTGKLMFTECFAIDKPGLRGALERCLQTGETAHYHELQVDGAACALTIRPLEGGAVVCFRQSADKGELEEARIRTARLESLALLAGGIAHDFNNILTSIVGNISLARMLSPANASAKEVLAESEKAALRAKDLTRQLISFARGGKPVKQLIDLRELLRESANFSTRGSSARCHFSVEDSLLPVKADPGQIGQVISNMVINAMQAMPGGGTIVISALNRNPESGKGDLDRDYVEIAISDQGAGIEPGKLDRIFDPYYSTKSEGHGLGLATSWSIIERHGGIVRVDSEPGKGTTFRIYLPACRHTAHKGAVQDTIRGKNRSKTFAPRNILLMDDEETVRTVSATMLSRLGHRVACAADGREAVALFREAGSGGEPFDLVILDMTVRGGMGGLETVAHLRKIDPNVQCILSTGHSEEMLNGEYREAGFSGFVCKPYGLKELQQAILALDEPGPD